MVVGKLVMKIQSEKQMYFVFLSFLRATIFNFVIFVTRYTRGVVSFFGKLKNISKHLVLPHLIINFVAGKLETVKGYKLCCNYSTESNCDAHVTISSTMVAIKNIYGDGSFASCIYILAIKIPFALNKCSLKSSIHSFLHFFRVYVVSRKTNSSTMRTMGPIIIEKWNSTIFSRSRDTKYLVTHSSNYFPKLLDRSYVILTYRVANFEKSRRELETCMREPCIPVWKMADERMNLVWSSWFRNSINELYRNQCNQKQRFKNRDANNYWNNLSRDVHFNTFFFPRIILPRLLRNY